MLIDPFSSRYPCITPFMFHLSTCSFFIRPLQPTLWRMVTLLLLLSLLLSASFCLTCHLLFPARQDKPFAPNGLFCTGRTAAFVAVASATGRGVLCSISCSSSPLAEERDMDWRVHWHPNECKPEVDWVVAGKKRALDGCGLSGWLPNTTQLAVPFSPAKYHCPGQRLTNQSPTDKLVGQSIIAALAATTNTLDHHCYLHEDRLCRVACY